jgi:hypothetical protein
MMASKSLLWVKLNLTQSNGRYAAIKQCLLKPKKLQQRAKEYAINFHKVENKSFISL